jgi:hypothetical protein
MERELAKCIEFDIQDDEHGGLMLGGHFDYEGGSCQGLGYNVDMDFIQRFMQVFGVSRLQQVNRKSCWVTHDGSGVVKIEPLHKNDGEPFSVKEWSSAKRLAQKAVGAGSQKD